MQSEIGGVISIVNICEYKLFISNFQLEARIQK